ncbi:sugar phosphate isomerase/epimerase [Tropicimonas sp. IMCC6043]|uniref:sugar phosphate isomerase/epimerase family protein n=1 Tax=Tropicimonas sp. IMCC6043 TaxID=2510645 RepID=UPI001A91CF67|nr:sugar phosphate isomerase/epimerase [Tropicimonas sp. IMCC6043]
MIRLALCNEVLREISFAEQCSIIADLGFDAVEIAPFTLSEDPAALTAAKRREIREIAGDAGLEIAGLHWLMNFPEGLSITDPLRAGEAGAHMEAMVELCADLGGEMMVHGSPDARNPADAPDAAAARAAAADCFARAGRAAEAAGVRYCLEPLSPSLTPFLNSVADCVEFIDEIGAPGLLTMLDTCAAADSEDRPAHEVLEKWLPTGRIGHVHVNDPNRRAPGQGEMRFGPVFDVLTRAGFAGYVSAEPFVYEPSGLACASVAAGYLRALRESVGEPS